MVKVVLFIFSVFLFQATGSASASASASNSKPGFVYERLGLVHFEKGKWAQAEEAFTKALESNPFSVEANYHLAELSYRKRKLEKALKHFIIVTKLDPQRLEATKRMALIYEKQGDFEKAIRTHKAIKNKMPQDYQTTVDFARFLERTGKLVEAEHYFREAFEVRQDVVGDLFDFALMLELMGDRADDAIIFYHKVLLVDSEHYKAHLNLGLSYQIIGKHGQAEEHLQNAIRIKPDSITSRMHLAIHYQNQKKYDQALAQYELITQLKPNVDHVYFNKAMIYINQENYERAAQQLYIVSGIHPRNVKAYLYRAWLNEVIGNPEGAEEEYLTVLHYEPHHLRAKKGLANLYFVTKQDAKALRWFKKLVHVEDTRDWAHLKLGELMIRQKKPSSAKTYLAKVPKFSEYETQRRRAVYATETKEEPKRKIASHSKDSGAVIYPDPMEEIEFQGYRLKRLPTLVGQVIPW